MLSVIKFAFYNVRIVKTFLYFNLLPVLFKTDEKDSCTKTKASIGTSAME